MFSGHGGSLSFVRGDADSLLDIYLWYSVSAVLVLNEDQPLAPMQKEGKASVFSQ